MSVRAVPEAAHDGLTWWVSPDAVREAIGAWAATSRAGRVRPGPERPSAETIRTAVGVACAIAELAAGMPDSPDAVSLQARLEGGRAEDASRFALMRPVPYDLRRLGDLAGAGLRDVERALDVLYGAGVVAQPNGARGPLALAPDAIVPAPAVASIGWAAVRERLGAVGAAIAAPCAVLRALAEQADAAGDGTRTADGPGAPVRLSVRDLEGLTGFGRSTVSDAVAALVRARLLDVDTRAGHTGRFVLRAAAFGAPDDAPAVQSGATTGLSPAPVPGAGAAGSAAPRGAVRAQAAAAPDAPGAAPISGPVVGASGAAPALIGSFAGTPIYAPAGTPLVVECDAAGRWSCRVGPYLQLGPIGPT